MSSVDGDAITLHDKGYLGGDYVSRRFDAKHFLFCLFMRYICLYV